jgi:TRAP-type C4-dicarboxylate transport system substrate-binding protein
MRRATAAIVVLAILSLAACSGAPRLSVVVLRMESPDPAGIEHDPAVAFFVSQVARLSGGHLRIDVEDYPRGQDGSVDEAGALRAVADGDADLGWAPTGSFDEVGVRAFDALDVPMLIDSYNSETVVIRSNLARRMLAGVEPAGLAGLALLSGPLDRLVGTSKPLQAASDIRGRTFALRPSSVLPMAVRALGGDPSPLSYQLVSEYPGLYVNAAQRPGPPAFLEDDLDSIFFDRYGGRCATQGTGCATSRPWVMTNVVLGPSTEAIVANPARMRGLSALQRSWLARAAADATSYSTLAADQDARLVPELCAAGVRFSTASPAIVASLRRAWRPLYVHLERGPTGSAIRGILALTSRTPAPPTLRIPRGCHRQPSQPYTAHGVRSTLPDGVYRIQVTAADIRAAGAQGLGGVWPAVETLTLRDGHWRLDFTEPTIDAEYGTYAGTPLRTAWWTDRAGQIEESFFSVVVNREGLRFYIVQSWDDYRVEHALYASHVWRRIGG